MLVDSRAVVVYSVAQRYGYVWARYKLNNNNKITNELKYNDKHNEIR